MTLEHSIFLVIALFIGWLFWQQLALRERALNYAKHLCDKSDVQLLDQSIGLASIRVKRLTRGGWGLVREYQFEFSSTGERRYTGRIYMVGNTVQNFEMDAFREPDRFI